MTPVRVGVIGTGWWATQFHLPALADNPHATIAALVDPDANRLTAAGDRFQVPGRFSDASDLFAAGTVDAVVIASPHSTHHELVKAALEHDLHVMCEKPFVLHSAHAHELVALADRRNLRLVVGHTYRFTRHALTARRLVQQGRIGELLLVSGLFASMVEAYYRGRPEEYQDVFGFPITGPDPRTYSDPALSGGGQAQTQITHAIDMVLWVTGRRTAEVHAYMNNLDLAVDVVDAVSFRLDNGAIGTMSSTGTLQPGQPQQQELRYYGTEGFLLQELIHGKLVYHGNDGTVEDFEDLAEHELYPADAPSARLVDLVRGAADDTGDLTDDVATVEFLEAAYTSAQRRAPCKTETTAGSLAS